MHRVKRAVFCFSTYRVRILLLLCIALQIPNAYPVSYIVNSSLDTNPAGGGSGSGTSGDLRYCMTQLNASGVAGTITFNIPSGSSTITLAGSLPVVQQGMTISTSVSQPVGATTTIDGVNSFRLFATFKAPLNISGVIIRRGLATGGNGGAGESYSGGGGGGLGAGGGIYVDLQQQLTISNINIQNNTARGGNGGAGGPNSGSNISSSGGGGASWTIDTANLNGGVLNNRTGGGDYPGASSTRGSTVFASATEGVSGYGGGVGGTGQSNTPGQPTANAAAGAASASVGGAGGYCGGGGGSGASQGGGGGNPGTVSNDNGGGGGGYGSGGGGGTGSGMSGGGGGLGGGGGGGAGLAVNGGGGGGGWGAGGGGGGSSGGVGGAFGGLFGGNGGNGTSSGGGGGGGGAIGGGIFVGDSATLFWGDNVTMTAGTVGLCTGTNNCVTAGTGGAGGVVGGNGTAYGTDIFLFQNSQLVFNGSDSLQTVAAAIQADQNNPVSPPLIPDLGITVSLGLASSTIALTNTNNNYRGNTTINSGILSISQDSTAGNSANLGIVPSVVTPTNIQFGGGTLATSVGLTLNSNRGITVNAGGGTIAPTGTLVYAGAITGSGPLAVNGTGILQIGSTNDSFTGALSITAGSLTATTTNIFQNTSSVTLSSATSIFNANNFAQAINNLSGVTGATITLGTAAITINQSNIGGLTYAGGISGSIAAGTPQLTYAGTSTSTLTLSGTNTYTGATAIQSGTISITADSNLGTAPGAFTATQLTLGGGATNGALQVSAGSVSLNTNRGITLLAGGGTLSTPTGTTLTVNGAITGTGALTILGGGTGTSVLNSTTSTYSGGTIINSGAVSISQDGLVGGSTGNLGIVPNSAVATNIQLNGGTLATNTNSFILNSNRGITLLAGGGGIAVEPGLSLTYNGIIQGAVSGAFAASGFGTLILGGVNTFTGATTISNGTVTVSADNNLGNTANTLTFNSGTLNVAPVGASLTISNTRTMTLNATGGTLSAASGKTLAYGTVGNLSRISGVGALTISGGGIISLSLDTATSTYSGGTVVNAGTLSTNWLGTAAGPITFGGGTLITTATITQTGTVLLNDNAVIQPATGTILTLNGNISDGATAKSLTMSGLGTLVLGGTNSYRGGTNVQSGILQVAGNNLPSTGTITVANGGTYTQTGGTSPIVPFILQAGGTANITGTLSPSGGSSAGTIIVSDNSVLFNNGTFDFTAGTLTLTGPDGVLSNSGTLVLGAATSGGGSIGNSGTLTVTSSLAVSDLTNITTLIFSGGSTNNSTPISNQGIFNITGDTTNSAVLTNYLTMSLRAGLSGGSIDNKQNANLTFDGATNSASVANAGIFDITGANSINTASITNASTGQIRIATGLLNAGSITNNSGTITLQTNANVANSIANTAGTLYVTGTATAGVITGSGTVNVDTTGILAASSYTNSGTHVTSIANDTDFGRVNATTANLNNATIITTAFSATSGSWEIITGVGPNSVTAVGTTYVLPNDTGALFGVWTGGLNSDNSAIVLSVERESFIQVAAGANTFAQDVAAVLEFVQDHITNPGQQFLIDAFYDSTSVADFIYNLNQMVPNVNVNTANFWTQDALFSKVEARTAAVADKRAITGYTSGNVTPNTSLWIGTFGNVAKQNQGAEGVNTGYRVKSLGGLIGIDAILEDNSVFGFALAYNNADISQMSNPNFTTKSLSYYGLLYGSMTTGNFFTEWVLGGATNSNAGTRGVVIASNNMQVNSKYYGWQGGVKCNIGNYTNWFDKVRFAHILSIQYAYLHQPSYAEYGSAAALNVNPEVGQNMLTLGTGIRLSLPGYNSWLTGSRELRAMVTYDAVQPKQTTTANFVVGSPSFGITNVSPSPWAYQIGADLATTFFRHLQLQISYDIQLRAGFYDNIGEVKLRYLF